MKMNFKRTLSLILAVLMVMTAVPLSGMATGTEHEHVFDVPVKIEDEDAHRFNCACGQKGSITNAVYCSGGTATCEAKAICDVCESPYGETLDHEYTESVVNDDFIKTLGNCQTKTVYYKSCVCGALPEDRTDAATFEGALGECVFTDYKANGDATCTNPGTKEAVCDICGEEKDVINGGDADKLAHTFVDVADEEYLKTPATCENKAVYYKSCSVCGAASETETFETTTIPHSFAAVEDLNRTSLASPQTCSAPAKYYKVCTKCNVVARHVAGAENETFDYGTKHNKPSTALEVVKPTEVKDEKGNALLKESDYLRKNATCGDNEIYSYVCAKCYEPMIAKGTDMSGNEIMLNGIHFYYKDGTANNPGHTDASKNMTLVVAEVKPTCTEDGKPAEYKCNVLGCDGYLVVKVEGEDYKAKGHTFDPKEKVVYTPATCVLNGTYGHEYCTTCKNDYYYDATGAAVTETYTKLNPLSKTGHADNNEDQYCDKCDVLVTAQDTCTCACHNDQGLMYFVALILKFFWKLTGTNPYCPAPCGQAHY